MMHKDKIKHFLISFVLAALIYWLTQNEWLAILSTLGVGLAKELYDQNKGKNTAKESLADILTDVVGITLGILFSYYILL